MYWFQQVYEFLMSYLYCSSVSVMYRVGYPKNYSCSCLKITIMEKFFDQE